MKVACQLKATLCQPQSVFETAFRIILSCVTFSLVSTKLEIGKR
ncbi:hypothetical protein RRG08_033846 [Elysia crispata]|uniref:Uncharacterized protein n=1 Tax=Elysia crispata TaxID=231223 RepID=A0AAE1EBM1_9GAST|nr:hypothetical protein RRG08_033846 [Elysia crispata]